MFILIQKYYQSKLYSYLVFVLLSTKWFDRSPIILSKYNKMSLKVAVRVRPFNKREIELHPSQTPKPIIQMNNNITTLLATETQKSKDFAFDYSFWSHSEYMELEDGYLKPTSEKYADQ